MRDLLREHARYLIGSLDPFSWQHDALKTALTPVFYSSLKELARTAGVTTSNVTLLHRLLANNDQVCFLCSEMGKKWSKRKGREKCKCPFQVWYPVCPETSITSGGHSGTAPGTVSNCKYCVTTHVPTDDIISPFVQQFIFPAPTLQHTLHPESTDFTRFARGSCVFVYSETRFVRTRLSTYIRLLRTLRFDHRTSPIGLFCAFFVLDKTYFV